MKERLVVYNESWGVGDALLLTANLRQLRLARPGVEIGCVSRHSAVLRFNPDIDILYDALEYPPDAHDHLFTPDAEVCYIGYHRQRRRLFREHVIDVVSSLLELQPGKRQLYYFVQPAEAAWAGQVLTEIRNAAGKLPVILFQATAAYTSNKEWPLRFWGELVARLSGTRLVQIGSANEPRVPDTVDLLGKTTLRQAIALVRDADCVVSGDSFLGHAAASVGTPGVVLFGPTPPSAFGHTCNRNLTCGSLECMPCLRPAQLELDTIVGTGSVPPVPWCCSHRTCMQRITPAAVEETVTLALKERNRCIS